jgi:GDP/UDP-N,N'-diacetylbacillosamine 2-epimerase (hydrolysing)
MKKVCIVTGSRAEYGLLKPLIELVHRDGELELQLIVTGSHLSPVFGETWKGIEADGLPIHKKIEILLASDSPVAVSKAMGLAQISFSEAFAELKPDIVVILGDRYEMLAIASAALIAKIPIAHLHGGELTLGAIDDSIRHAITKMSSLHLTSTEEYRNRVIQMGEHPETVFNTGAIGLDNIKNLRLLDRIELQEALGITLHRQNFLVTFHPETRSNISAREHTEELLAALNGFNEALLLFTGANADVYGSHINETLRNYADQHPGKAVFFDSLGQQKYLSCLREFDLVIGNSSSGIIEAPSFGIPVINIGERQKGRIMAANIINCGTRKEEIVKAIHKGLSAEFKKSLTGLKSPYGDGNAAPQILHIIKTQPIAIEKQFYDAGNV